MLSADGKIVVPFEFDSIAENFKLFEFDSDGNMHKGKGGGMAQLNGKLVKIRFKDYQYIGTTDVAKLKPQDYAGNGYAGIGVAIKRLMPSDETIMVVDVLAKGPADKAGDSIVSIDDVPVNHYVTIDDVTKILLGPIDTKVKVKYIRHCAAFITTIERGLVAYN